MTRGNRKGYWGTGKLFSGGGVGENLGGDSTGSPGVGDELGCFEELVVVNVALDLQFLNALLNVSGVTLEKAVPPYVSIQSRVFQLCEGSVDEWAVVGDSVKDVHQVILKRGGAVEIGHGVRSCSKWLAKTGPKRAGRSLNRCFVFLPKHFEP